MVVSELLSEVDSVAEPDVGVLSELGAAEVTDVTAVLESVLEPATICSDVCEPDVAVEAEADVAPALAITVTVVMTVLS